MMDTIWGLKYIPYLLSYLNNLEVVMARQLQVGDKIYIALQGLYSLMNTWPLIH